MTMTSRPSGRLTAMIWRMRLRVALALGQSSTSTARLNASHGPDEQRDHQPADHLHQVDVEAGTGKAAEGHDLQRGMTSASGAPPPSWPAFAITGVGNPAPLEAGRKSTRTCAS
jgi:hypothetical protein